jgi:NAD(P)-dependent dehydrogenase (short-subunit alcohol dehydrogenase family)
VLILKTTQMKTVLITGANKGIGFETAKQLAQLGYYVYLGSRDKAKGLEAIKKLSELGISNAAAIEIDVADIDSIKQARKELESTIGQLDVLINNAGIAGDQPQNMSVCDMGLLRSVFETNYFGAIQTTQQFIPLLKRSALPIIVNVSTEIGSLTMQTSPGRHPNWNNYHAYGSSKTALNAFTINSVTPGYTATDLNAHQGLKTVEQGARPIVKYATLGPDGPTGKFFKEEGEVAW